MNIKGVSLGFLFLFSVPALSQDIPAIQTDRPDQTECPFIVPAGYLQGEVGFNYERTDVNEKNLLYPTVLWRYGINSRFEFRFITELAGSELNSKSVSGLNPVRMGFKVLLAEEKGLIPQTAFIGHLIFPDLASTDLKGDFYASTFRFVMAHTISRTLSLSYNVGAEWDGFTPDPSFIYTLSAAMQLSDKVGCYTELYGYFPQLAGPDHRADAGFTFFLKKNLMLDISGGVGVTNKSPDYYGSVGFSFRIPK
jgi:hypothetical protein